MTANPKQLAAMKVPVNIDRHFRFELCTPFHDVQAIKRALSVMADELNRLGLDSLRGCKNFKRSARRP